MKSAFFFDVDDTLCDTGALHAAAFSRTFLELDIEARYFDYLSISGQRTEDVFRRILGENADARVTEASKVKRAYFHDLIQEARSMTGAIEILKYLSSEGRKLYAVSSGSSASVIATLTATHMIKFFEEVITCDNVGKTKPYPDPYIRAIELSGYTPQDCVAIEDSETGVVSALAAGLEVALISPKAPDWVRSYSIKHYESLELLLKRIQGQRTC
jgi:HAD superfamily hydrolase (TIGR01509 family)